MRLRARANYMKPENLDTLREQRNRQIRKEFFRLHDVEGKRNEVIYALLSQKYFLAPGTIERIVFQRGRYRATDVSDVAMNGQLPLFGKDDNL